MSISRLVGICFIAGAVLNFIPFVVNIILGGNPAEGEPVMDYFYKNIINGGFNSRLFAVFGTLSAALLAYAVNALSNIEQEKEKNALKNTLKRLKKALESFEKAFKSSGNAWKCPPNALESFQRALRALERL